jgi:putative membrane protein
MKSIIHTILCGMAMGCADAVPGVSGGTIALILGFYERLLEKLNAVVTALRRPWSAGDRANGLAALGFLLPLGLGLGSALFIATRLLVGKLGLPPDLDDPARAAELQTHLAHNPPAGWLLNPATAPIVFAFFFGLVALSIRVPWHERRASSAWDIPLLLIGATAAAVISLSPPLGGSLATWALVGAGMVAISVMLLPGVSGSLALLVLGMYQPVSSAIHDKQLGILLSFGTGIVLGLILVVPLLRRLLVVAHNHTMAFLSGLMLGSLVALWPWKAHYLPKLIVSLGPMTPQAPHGAWWWCLLAAVLGGTVIFAGDRLANRAQR